MHQSRILVRVRTPFRCVGDSSVSGPSPRCRSPPQQDRSQDEPVNLWSNVCRSVHALTVSSTPQSFARRRASSRPSGVVFSRSVAGTVTARLPVLICAFSQFRSS